MRDFQVTNEVRSFHNRTAYWRRHRDNAKIWQSFATDPPSLAPKFLKGRADLTTGPKPLPTPYYGFRFVIRHEDGHFHHKDYQIRYFSGHGYMSLNTEKWEVYPLTFDALLSSNFTKFEEGEAFGFYPDVSAETRAGAANSANDSLRSEHVNVGQTIGEIPEGLREFSQTAIAVGKTIVALKRGKLGLAKKLLRSLLTKRGLFEAVKLTSSSYLFYIFGVKPILNDMNHMMHEIHKASEQPNAIKVKGTRAAEVIPFRIGFSTQGSLTEVCEVGYNVRPSSLYREAFLGLTNPLATAWELVPLSFIANWFVSIGQTLSALDAGVGLEFVSGYRTTVVKGKYSYTPFSVYNWTPLPKYHVDAFSMRRVVLTRPDIPPLHLKSGGLNGSQLVTLGALLTSFTDGDKIEKAYGRKGR